MKNKIKLLLTVLLILTPFKSLALIEVDITRGNLSPLPLAVSPLSANKNDKEALQKKLNINDIGLEISNIVENNLKKSGLFNPLSKDAFLQKPDIAHLKPRFEDWSLIKAQALITGKVNLENEKLPGKIIECDCAQRKVRDQENHLHTHIFIQLLLVAKF